MKIPIFFLILIAVAALLVVTIAVYFQVYKRNINKALKADANTGTPMTPPYKFAIILTIIVMLIGIATSYFVGFKVAYDRYEEAISQTSKFDIQTYYAQVIKVSESQIEVEGIELNDQRFRGTFTYNIYTETKLEWHDSSIDLSDLNEGDLIAVTLITDIGGITDIYKIQLLDDEM